MLKYFSHINEVHIWIIDVYETPIETEYLLFLSKEEKDTFLRIFPKKNRALYFYSHLCLRYLLSYYTDFLPQNIIYDRNQFGKPGLSRDGNKNEVQIQFNMSHSESKCIYAFTQESLIGVDIEYIKTDIDVESLVPYVFSENEQRIFYRLKNDMKIGIFYSLWTQKEAVVKGLGAGLQLNPKMIEFYKNSKGNRNLLCPLIHNEKKSKWSVQSLFINDEYKAAFAVNKNVIKVIKRETNSNEILKLLNVR